MAIWVCPGTMVQRVMIRNLDEEKQRASPGCALCFRSAAPFLRFRHPAHPGLSRGTARGPWRATRNAAPFQPTIGGSGRPAASEDQLTDGMKHYNLTKANQRMLPPAAMDTSRMHYWGKIEQDGCNLAFMKEMPETCFRPLAGWAVAGSVQNNGRNTETEASRTLSRT